MFAKKVKVKETDGTTKLIGQVLGDTFYSFRSEVKHMFRNGVEAYSVACQQNEKYWGIDAAAVDWMMKNGIVQAIIVTKKAVYKTALANFLSQDFPSKVIDFPPHRKQYVLHFDAFEQEPPGSLNRAELVKAKMSFKL